MYICNVKELFTPHQLVLSMMVFLAIIFMMILIIIILMILSHARSKRESDLNNRLDNLISELSLCESVDEFDHFLSQHSTTKILKEIASSKKSSLFVLRKISQAYLSLKGVALDHLKSLYRKMDLERVVFRELNSRKWHRRAFAIQVISRFGGYDAIEILRKFINDNNVHVRTEAQIGMVRLNGFDGFADLLDLNESISEWQQLCLIYVSNFHQFNHVWILKKMLKSTNEGIVVLGLKLTMFYSCFELLEDVRMLKSHCSEDVRKNAKSVLMKFQEGELLWN